MTALKLSGTWEALLDFSKQYKTPQEAGIDDGWESIQVPGCWEKIALDRVSEGPVWYRRVFQVPFEWSGKPVILDFQGVNYYCEVWLNNQFVGDHAGGWTAFRVSVSEVINFGGPNEMFVKVLKQGETFPLRDTLAGFLADVDIMFGGIWKDVWLRQVPSVEVTDVFVKPSLAENLVRVEYGLLWGSLNDATTSVTCVITDASEQIVAKRMVRHQITDPGVDERTTHEIELQFESQAECWSPERPTLYECHIRCTMGDVVLSEHRSRFGMREVSVHGTEILVNKTPMYLRGVLNWGWYPEHYAPIPSTHEIRTEFERIKQSGFNMIKLCLYVPTQDYLDIADEVGILIWQELPMWLPNVTDQFKAKTFEQYDRIIREVRNHPSVVMWTLGCELNQQADDQFLKELYDMAKCLTNNAILRDNSGSGECYGGLLKENADFYDYHFYTDVHFFPDLMAQFAGPWRPSRPWLFGEFCDYDTFRDVHRLRDEHGGELPWWLEDNPLGNPASKTKAVSYAQQEKTLMTLNLPFSAEDLRDNALKSSRVYRKAVLELIRTYPQVSGYVITSIRDTPLATSGVFDDFNEPKCLPEETLKFNNDTVITLTWDHRREWVNGGDRVVNWDHFNYRPGESIRPHVFISHYGHDAIENAPLQWKVIAQPEPRFVVQGLGDGPDASGLWVDAEIHQAGVQPHEMIAQGFINVSMQVGQAGEVEVVEFVAPATPTVQKLRMCAKLSLGDKVVENTWDLWILPSTEVPDFTLYDPRNLFKGIEDHFVAVSRVTRLIGIPVHSVVVATEWDNALDCFVQQGGNVLYVQDGEGRFPTVRAPFWRESVQLFYEHPLTFALPHENHTGSLLNALATDSVFAPNELPLHVPILGRLDARLFYLHQYMVEIEIGKGRVIATTLRLQGGVGGEPTGIGSSPVGLYLMAQVVRYLGA